MFKIGGKKKDENSYSLFEAWLDGVLFSAGPPPEVLAFNFNIYDGAEGSFDLELIGAPRFDADDEDWACEELFASGLYNMPAATAHGPGKSGGFEGLTSFVRRYLQKGRFRQALLGAQAVGVGHVSGAITLLHQTVPDVPRPAVPVPDTPPVDELRAEQSLPDALAPGVSPADNTLTTVAAKEAIPNRQQAPAVPQPDTGPRVEEAACYKLLRGARPHAICASPKHSYGIRPYELLRGEVFSRWNDGFTFEYRAEKGDVPTDLLYNTLGWLLVSGRLRAAWEEMGAEAEYFPVRVEEAQSGRQQPDYWVANLLCKRDALCPEESEYTTVENEIYGIYRPVKRYTLRQSALAGADIFKLTDHQEIPVFVTARFKKNMDAAGFTGLAYFPVQLV